MNQPEFRKNRKTADSRKKVRRNRLNLFVLIWKKNIKIYCMPHFGSLNCRVYLTNDAHISHAKTDVVLKYSLKSDGVHQVCCNRKSNIFTL